MFFTPTKKEKWSDSSIRGASWSFERLQELPFRARPVSSTAFSSNGEEKLILEQQVYATSRKVTFTDLYFCNDSDLYLALSLSLSTDIPF